MDTARSAEVYLASRQLSGWTLAHHHEVIPVHDLAIVPMTELGHQSFRGSPQPRRKFFAGIGHQPTGRDHAVRRYQFHRIARLKHTPPGPGWDGVYTATTK